MEKWIYRFTVYVPQHYLEVSCQLQTPAVSQLGKSLWYLMNRLWDYRTLSTRDKPKANLPKFVTQ